MKEFTVITVENGYLLHMYDEKNEQDPHKRIKKVVVEAHNDPRAELEEVCKRLKEYFID